VVKEQKKEKNKRRRPLLLLNGLKSALSPSLVGERGGGGRDSAP
jgi:hypothetical protein